MGNNNKNLFWTDVFATIVAIKITIYKFQPGAEGFSGDNMICYRLTMTDHNLTTYKSPCVVCMGGRFRIYPGYIFWAKLSGA